MADTKITITERNKTKIVLKQKETRHSHLATRCKYPPRHLLHAYPIDAGLGNYLKYKAGMGGRHFSCCGTIFMTQPSTVKPLRQSSASSSTGHSSRSRALINFKN